MGAAGIRSGVEERGYQADTRGFLGSANCDRRSGLSCDNCSPYRLGRGGRRRHDVVSSSRSAGSANKKLGAAKRATFDCLLHRRSRTATPTRMQGDRCPPRATPRVALPCDLPRSPRHSGWGGRLAEADHREQRDVLRTRKRIGRRAIRVASAQPGTPRAIRRLSIPPYL